MATVDPRDRRSPSVHSTHSRAASQSSLSMGPDGGEAGRRAAMAAEDEYIRRELADETSFCNAFWGSGDDGYDMIMARIRGSSRTLDELRAVYRERAEIEADYSKKLSKLAKSPLGRDESG